MATVEYRVRQILQAYLDTVHDVAGHWEMDQLGADSLDLTEIEIAIEEEFGIEFPMLDLTITTTVIGLITMTERFCREQGVIA